MVGGGAKLTRARPCTTPVIVGGGVEQGLRMILDAVSDNFEEFVCYFRQFRSNFSNSGAVLAILSSRMNLGNVGQF